MRIFLFFLLLVCLAVPAFADWEYRTPTRDFSVTLPLSAAHDVSNFTFDNVKRTGFYIDSVTDKKLFAPCPNVREFGVWSEPYRDETSFRKFVTEKFGRAAGDKEKILQFGSFTGFQLERAYVGYKGVKTFSRVVGVHTPEWSHVFYCMWHKNGQDPAVMAFFSSIKSAR